MDKKSDYFFLILFFLVFFVSGYRFYQYMIAENFPVHVNTSCDPSAESCFSVSCTPGDTTCDSSPYAKVIISDSDIPKCLEEHSCDRFSCGSIASCTESYCSSDTLEDGETCTTTVPTLTSN